MGMDWYKEPAAKPMPVKRVEASIRGVSKFSNLPQRRCCSWDNEIPIGFHNATSALLDREDGAGGGWCVTVGHSPDSESQYRVCITGHSERLQLWTNSITVWLQAKRTELVLRNRERHRKWGGEGGLRSREEDGKSQPDPKLFILPIIL